MRYLCNEFHTKLQCDSTLRETVTVEKRVAIAVWRLGANIKYRTISHLFSVDMSTACNIVHEACTATVDSPIDTYINIPEANGGMDIVSGFEGMQGS